MNEHVMDESGNGLTVHVKLTIEDFIRFNFALLLKNTIVKGVLVVNLILLFLALYLWVNEGFYSVPIPLLIIPLVFIGLLPYLTYRNAKANLPPVQQKQRTYTFIGNEISVMSESVQAKYTWKNLYKTMELKHFFVLFESKNSVLIIPKRCLANAQSVRLQRVLKANQQKSEYSHANIFPKIIMFMLAFLLLVGIFSYIVN